MLNPRRAKIQKRRADYDAGFDIITLDAHRDDLKDPNAVQHKRRILPNAQVDYNILTNSEFPDYYWKGINKPFVDEQGQIKPHTIERDIEVDTKVPKLGLMLVGLGGNNGTTLTGGLLANKKSLKWRTRQGVQSANFYGSFTQSVVTKVGVQYDKATNIAKDVFRPIKDLVPLVNPDDIQVTGWDISKMNLQEACYRAGVLEPTLIEQLPELKDIVPMPAVFNPDYIASNQSDRVDNVFVGTNQECVDKIRHDI